MMALRSFAAPLTLILALASGQELCDPQVTTVLQPNRQCGLDGAWTLPVSMAACCPVASDGSALAAMLQISEGSATRPASTSSEGSNECRGMATNKPFCEGSSCHLTAADRLVIKLDMDSSLTEGACCQRCTCTGDPVCSTKVDGQVVQRHWRLCDGRRRSGPTMCRTRRDTCIEQTDHEGKPCVWEGKRPDGSTWKNILASGSSCQPNWSRKDITFPTMVMHRSPELEVRLELEERGIIRRVLLSGSSSSGDWTRSLDAALCHQYDPRKHLATVGSADADVLTFPIPRSRYPVEASAVQDAGAADFAAGAWGVNAEALAQAGVLFEVQLPNAAEVQWKVMMKSTGLALDLVCTTSMPPGDGDIDTFADIDAMPSMPRIDVRSLVDPSGSADKEGFCASGEIAEVASEAQSAAERDFLETCMQRHLPDHLSNCRTLMDPTCNQQTYATLVSEWCSSCFASSDAEACEQELTHEVQSEPEAVANRWVKRLAKLNKDKLSREMVRQLISENGVASFLASGAYRGTLASCKTDKGCGVAANYGKQLEVCSHGVSVEFLRAGVWEQELFIPRTRPPCGGQLTLTGDLHPNLFQYPVRVVDCSSLGCLGRLACSSSLAFDVSLSFQTRTSDKQCGGTPTGPPTPTGPTPTPTPPTPTGPPTPPTPSTATPSKWEDYESWSANETTSFHAVIDDQGTIAVARSHYHSRSSSSGETTDELNFLRVDNGRKAHQPGFGRLCSLHLFGMGSVDGISNDRRALVSLGKSLDDPNAFSVTIWPIEGPDAAPTLGSPLLTYGVDPDLTATDIECGVNTIFVSGVNSTRSQVTRRFRISNAAGSNSDDDDDDDGGGGGGGDDERRRRLQVDSSSVRPTLAYEDCGTLQGGFACSINYVVNNTEKPRSVRTALVTFTDTEDVNADGKTYAYVFLADERFKAASCTEHWEGPPPRKQELGNFRITRSVGDLASRDLHLAAVEDLGHKQLVNFVALHLTRGPSDDEDSVGGGSVGGDSAIGIYMVDLPTSSDKFQFPETTKDPLHCAWIQDKDNVPNGDAQFNRFERMAFGSIQRLTSDGDFEQNDLLLLYNYVHSGSTSVTGWTHWSGFKTDPAEYINAKKCVKNDPILGQVRKNTEPISRVGELRVDVYRSESFQLNIADTTQFLPDTNAESASVQRSSVLGATPSNGGINSKNPTPRTISSHLRTSSTTAAADVITQSDSVKLVQDGSITIYQIDPNGVRQIGPDNPQPIPIFKSCQPPDRFDPPGLCGALAASSGVCPHSCPFADARRGQLSEQLAAIALPLCPDCALDALQASQARLKLAFRLTGPSAPCCRTCAVWGDPVGESFNKASTDKHKWLVCDGRDPAKGCQVTREQCEQTVDHVGNACVFDAGLVDKPVARFGSPCQADWAKSGLAGTKLYEVEDAAGDVFKVAARVGERGVLKELYVRYGTGDDRVALDLNADACFPGGDDDDASTEASALYGWDHRVGENDLNTASSGDEVVVAGQSGSLFAGKAIAVSTTSASSEIRRYMLEFARGGNEFIRVNVTCLRVYHADSGTFGGNRLNVDALLDSAMPSNVATAADGFCANSDFAGYVPSEWTDASLLSEDQAKPTQVQLDRNGLCPDTLPNKVALCEALTGLDCSELNVYDRAEGWCEERSRSRNQCRNQALRSNRRVDTSGWIRQFCDTIACVDQDLCVSRVINGGAADVRDLQEQCGGSTAASTCKRRLDQYDTQPASDCELGVFVEVFDKEAGTWDTLAFVPDDDLPCAGEEADPELGSLDVALDAASLPLFNAYVRFRRTDVNFATCSDKVICARKPGFHVDFDYSTSCPGSS